MGNTSFNKWTQIECGEHVVRGSSVSQIECGEHVVRGSSVSSSEHSVWFVHCRTDEHIS